MLSEANGTAYFKDMKLVKGEYPYSYLYTRDFENATVFLRPELDGITKSNGPETAKTFTLGQSYNGKLENDGSITSGTTNSISLRSLEAAIMVK